MFHSKFGKFSVLQFSYKREFFCCRRFQVRIRCSHSLTPLSSDREMEMLDGKYQIEQILGTRLLSHSIIAIKLVSSKPMKMETVDVLSRVQH